MIAVAIGSISFFICLLFLITGEKDSLLDFIYNLFLYKSLAYKQKKSL